MDITTGMEAFQRFQDDGYKNWIKTTMGLQYLKTRLGSFLENETETYHQSLRNKINSNSICRTKCDFKKGDLKKWRPSGKQVPPTCEACVLWRDEIWANHLSRGRVYWDNCTPYLWPTEKWEVAKVYMGQGHTSHKTVGEFDISAFLNLMTACLHFKDFAKNNLISNVTNVRNQVMHSANFKVKAKDLECFLDRIRGLGEALAKRVPEFQALAKEIDELQNIDFNLILCRAERRDESMAHAAGEESLKIMRAHEFLNMELDIMKEKMEFLAQRDEGGGENVLTLEDLQCVKGFLEGNRDLQERLGPQWERLREVQEQHGQQLDSLTGRVDELEKKTTLTPEPKSVEFSTDIIMYKNHLFEDARKHGWPEPDFSVKKESTGYRGQVVIKGRTFTGLQVCRSKTDAHQEVAKIALDQLAKETDSDVEDVEASVSQPHQSESVSPAGSSFFGSVTVDLDIKVVPDEGCPGTAEAVESAYKKLAPLFGLALSESASSYKEAVLQYCQKRDIPPPKEISESDCFSLRVNGPITFHDSEGSSNKKQAQRQAAKVALQGLCGVLGKKEVLNENYVGVLKELLDARKLERVAYDVTPRAGGGSVGDQERDGQGGGREREEVSEGRGGGRGEHAVDELSERGKRTGGPNQGPKPSWTDTSVSMETHQATPATPEERSISGVGGQFLGCVKVAIKKELSPCVASSQEGAVQAAYRNLLHALSLGTSAGGEKQSVMEFFTQIKCRPPMEELVTPAEGIHSCTLKIDGEPFFQSPEGAVKKQQAEQLAAKEALRHLGGLLGGNSTNLSGEKNCKGKLQELLAKHGSGATPEYSTTDRPTPGTVTAPGQVTEVSSVIGSIQQADVPSVSHAVTTDSAHEGSEPPLCKKWAPTNQGPKPLQTDTPVSMETQATPALPEEKSISGDGGQFFGCVKVAIKKELSPCVASNQEGAVQAAYRNLLHALSLGTSAGGEKQSVMEFFTQIKCRPPMEELVTPAEGIHSCTLKIYGEPFFQSPEGAVKKQQAEQLAAKEALRHLGGLLGGNSTNLSGEKNCKGKLQELLAKHGSGATPEYSTTDRPTPGTVTAPGQVTEVSSVIGSIQQADVPSVSHAVTTDSAHEGSEPPLCKKWAPTNQGPKPLQTDTPVSMETQATPALPEEKSISGDGGQFFGCVKVAIKKELSPCVASNQEGAVQAAYRNLLHALSLGTSAGGEKQSVMEFFTQIKCRPPMEELVTPAEGIHSCTLKIDGEPFFQSPEGASKKQQAEQLAAKEALRHLGGLLGGNSTNLSGEKNCKGKLQELLAKNGSGATPEYSTTDRPTLGTVTAPGQVTEVSSGSIQHADVPLVSHAVTMDSAHEDSEPPPSKTFAEMQSDGPIKEIRRYLALLSLQPQTVVCESVCLEQQCEWRACVSFERFTFRNNKLFDSKRDASRSSFLTLGLAGEICQPDESKVKGKVNQFFSKRSLPLPKEVLEEPEPQRFSCSLTDITCDFTYTARARQSACQRALSCISPLTGYCGLVALPSSTEEAELRLRTLLEGAGLKLSISTHTEEYRSSATLKFSGYCMETKGQGSKKDTRNGLSQRLLKLLEGQETMSTNKDLSMRNLLDMWFVKHHLDKPVFEDTDTLGTRVTFSAPLHCSHTDWQDSQEKAVRRLREELQRRVQNLSE